MAKSPAWTRKEGKSEKGGLNAKGRASYNAANPGKPGLKAPQPEGGARKKSFCAQDVWDEKEADFFEDGQRPEQPYQ
jgi:hypothetical protein